MPQHVAPQSGHRRAESGPSRQTRRTRTYPAGPRGIRGFGERSLTSRGGEEDDPRSHEDACDEHHARGRVGAGMKAVVTERPGDYDVMRVADVPIPVLGPREALVRNFASGVCYHDHLIRAGVMKRGITFPLILGHEGAGIVQAVGSAVRSLTRGARVACAQCTESCGFCRYCRTTREPLCAERKLFGHDRDGTYAEQFKIQEDALLPLPPEVSFEDGAILSCAIGT